MQNWFRTSLGDGMTTPMPSAEIEEVFRNTFTTKGRPPEMAVFTRPESEGRLHCEVIAYFSPARLGLDLLAGDQGCWSVLFPAEA